MLYCIILYCIVLYGIVLQLLSPSGAANGVTACYQSVSTTASTGVVQRHHQRPSTSSGLPYYGVLPGSISYSGMIADHNPPPPLDHLMFSGPPGGGGRGGGLQNPRTDCSLVQLQQLTSRLGNPQPPPPLDMAYGMPDYSICCLFCVLFA